MPLDLVRRRIRLAALTTAAVGVAPAHAASQSLDDPLVPRGEIRVGIAPSLASWSETFGETAPSLAGPLQGPLGTSLFPSLAPDEALLREVTGASDLSLVVGMGRASITSDRWTVPFEARVGVFDRLTIGVVVPLVKARTEVAFALSADEVSANMGLSPARSDPGATQSLLDGLDQAAAAALARAQTICDTDGTGSPTCMQAQALAADAGTFHTDLDALYGGSPFFPIAGSSAGMPLAETYAALLARLTEAGIAGAPTDLLYATPLTFEELNGILQGPGFGFAGDGSGRGPLETWKGLWEMGDVEVMADLRLFEGGFREDSVAGLAYRVGVGGGVRLPTGSRDLPALPFDLGSGDGQTDIIGRAFAVLAWDRITLFARGSFELQQSAEVERRVAAPGELLPEASSALLTEWDPGDRVTLLLAPSFRIAGGLSAELRYLFESKGEDSYISLEEGAPDPSPLATDSESRLHLLGVGLSLLPPRGRAPDSGLLPVELRARVSWSLSGSGRDTPSAIRWTIEGRAYRRLWGG